MPNDQINSVIPGGIFFDLDGTLADTAPDLGNALNQLLVMQGREPLPIKVIRPYVSRGTPALLDLGFQITADDLRYPPLRTQFLKFYSNNICDSTTLFPGIAQLITDIEKQGVLWGIVTNKPHALTVPLLKKLPFPHQPAIVVSGDTLAAKKPHPEPLLHACARIGVNARQSLYIGDDHRDIQAARAAHMRSIAVTYGYTLPEDDPSKWKATFVADDVVEIALWLKRHYF
ncbi:MAG: 2-phosphoglycolate phosphatase [Parasphingorhabdus sp.]|jgi:2-phosphoglycolate phosphatase